MVALCGAGCTEVTEPASTPEVAVIPLAVRATIFEDVITHLVTRFDESSTLVGKSKFKVERTGSGALVREFEIEVSNGTPGDRHAASIDGVAIATLIIDGKGTCEIDYAEDASDLFPAGFREPRDGSTLEIDGVTVATYRRLERQVHIENMFGEADQPRGEIDYKCDHIGGEVVRSFKAEIRRALDHEAFAVTIDGEEVGVITTDGSGEGELKFSIDDAPFPAGFRDPKVGSVVRIGAYEITLEGEPAREATASAEPPHTAPIADTDTLSAWKLLHNGGDAGRRSPTAGEDAAAVYDGKRHRVLLFGGKNDADENINELWSFDLATAAWTLLGSNGPPPPRREDHSLIIDHVNDQLILYGGEDGKTSRDTWSFDLATGRWSEITHDSAPKRESHIACFDAPDRRMIVFGGVSKTDELDAETWALDLDRDGPGYGTWSIVDTGPTRPTARREHAAVHDAAHRRLYAFGGRQRRNDSHLDDVWVLDLATDRWSELETTGTGPPPVRRAAMAHDPRADELIVFGGEVLATIDGEEERLVVNGIWVLDVATRVWTDRTPHPRAIYDHVGVYVPELGGTLIYGGSSHVGKEHATWVLDSATRDEDATLTAGTAPTPGSPPGDP